ncbi:hypothetical protein [Streptomyces sp. CB03238]|uniref:hypothetical protein n=1 Tax=Streptomyces sp. CB03238 TaxID=1907777 RepID=UPI0015C41E2F|nr:hypothetical protein [Streptomyces sp. CB03238]
MRDRIGALRRAITQYEPRPCDGCGGQRGHVETSWGADGTRHDTWRPCGTCQGTGVR